MIPIYSTWLESLGETGVKNLVSEVFSQWEDLPCIIRLCLCSQHSTPPSAYGSVKPYTNFDAERDALNIETAVKTKGRLWSSSCHLLTRVALQPPVVPAPEYPMPFSGTTFLGVSMQTRTHARASTHTQIYMVHFPKTVPLSPLGMPRFLWFLHMPLQKTPRS